MNVREELIRTIIDAERMLGSAHEMGVPFVLVERLVELYTLALLRKIANDAIEGDRK